MSDKTVVHHFAAPTEAQFHAALVHGLARVAAKVGRGTLADKSGRTTRGLDKLFEGSNPTGKGLCDFLLADETALDEVLSLYGKKLCARSVDRSQDMRTITEMASVLARFTDALSDGVRDHNETLALAVLIGPLMPKLSAIVDEARSLRGLEV